MWAWLTRSRVGTRNYILLSPSALNMTLLAVAAEHGRVQHGARMQLSIDICCRRRRSAAANPPVAIATDDQWDRQTDERTDERMDRRTPYRCLHRPCSALCAGGVSNTVQLTSASVPIGLHAGPKNVTTDS